MKTIAIVLLIVPFWATDILAQEKDITGLLGNQDTRTAIFNTILNDHQLMMDFMDAMKDNHHAMMMQSDSAMMGVMIQNPEMMQKMMNNMMDMCEKDSTRCEHMAGVMSEQPHLMMMGMQKMKEKESGESNNTKSHHMHK